MRYLLVLTAALVSCVSTGPARTPAERDLRSASAAMEWSGPVPRVVHTLMPTPRTVVYGGYDPFATPALRIESGDEVEVGTVSTCGTRLLVPGADTGRVEPAIRGIMAAVRDSGLQRGPGGHVLTGPIYVSGADSGDVLEVRVKRVDLAIPMSCNSFGPRSGFLPEDFPGVSRSRLIPLDREKMLGRFDEGIDIPLRPFFGSMGVAPPPAVGRINSGPPGTHAGNLDNKELVEGTTLYIPVHVRGALFHIGDGHAAQGDGEVDITALETALTGRLQLIVRKDLRLTWPRGETSTHWIAMGTDRDLTVATKIAVREAIALLVELKGMSRELAYMLVSTACDVRITQLVDGNVGSHVMIPKLLFTK